MKLKPPKIIRHLFPSLIWEIDDPEGFPDLRRRPHTGHHGVDSGDAGEVRRQGDVFRSGQKRGGLSRSFPPHRGREPKVGNHTYSHQKGWGMSLERYIEDVDFANDLIHSELFRPPYARITPAQAGRCRSATSW